MNGKTTQAKQAELIMVQYCAKGYVKDVLESYAASKEVAKEFAGVVTVGANAGGFAVFFLPATPVIEVLKRGIELAPLVSLSASSSSVN